MMISARKRQLRRLRRSRRQEAGGVPAYPDFVRTESERRRWDVSCEAALNVVEQIGGDEVTVMLATRSLYKSDIPTHG